MFIRWHAMAQLTLIPALFVQGCALSHGGPEEVVPAAPVETTSPPAETWPSAPPEPAEAFCEAHRPTLSISVSTGIHSTEECGPGPVDGWIDGSLEEFDGGIAFVLDTCPPSADCDGSRRCEIRIEGIDFPLANALHDFEFEHLSGWVEPGFIRLGLGRRGECCSGRGCFCDLDIALYGRVGNPARPAPDLPLPTGAEDLLFERGATLCGIDVCGDKAFALEATLLPGATSMPTVPDPVVVAPRETTNIGGSGLRVRLLSSAYDECTDEPGTAAWVAWLDASAVAGEDSVGRPTP